MPKGKRSKPSPFVLRIKSLPPDVTQIGVTPDGTTLYADILGNVFAVRTELVVYRVLAGLESNEASLRELAGERRRKGHA